MLHLPHGMWVDGDRIYVADRENDRLQIFDLNGEESLDVWPGFLVPCDLFMDAADFRGWESPPG